jgi:hypothetical protein
MFAVQQITQSALGRRFPVRAKGKPRKRRVCSVPRPRLPPEALRSPDLAARRFDQTGQLHRFLLSHVNHSRTFIVFIIGFIGAFLVFFQASRDNGSNGNEALFLYLGAECLKRSQGLYAIFAQLFMKYLIFK